MAPDKWGNRWFRIYWNRWCKIVRLQSECQCYRQFQTSIVGGMKKYMKLVRIITTIWGVLLPVFFSQKDRSHLRVNRCLIQHIDNLTEIWCEHSQLHWKLYIEITQFLFAFLDLFPTFRNIQRKRIYFRIIISKMKKNLAEKNKLEILSFN
jgi:hypothetical protein